MMPVVTRCSGVESASGDGEGSAEPAMDLGANALVAPGSAGLEGLLEADLNAVVAPGSVRPEGSLAADLSAVVAPEAAGPEGALEDALEALLDAEFVEIGVDTELEQQAWHAAFPHCPAEPAYVAVSAASAPEPRVPAPSDSALPAREPPGAPRAERRRDGVLERWGPFVISRTLAARNPPHGGMQAACPFHRLSAATGCKQVVTLRSGSSEHEEHVLWALRHWCNGALDCHRQRHHIGAPGMTQCPTARSSVLSA